jgi:hypothetical protein
MYRAQQAMLGNLGAKNWIKKFTAHNGKLGYNWKYDPLNGIGSYVKSNNRQYKNSAYKAVMELNKVPGYDRFTKDIAMGEMAAQYQNKVMGLKEDHQHEINALKKKEKMHMSDLNALQRKRLELEENVSATRNYLPSAWKDAEDSIMDCVCDHEKGQPSLNYVKSMLNPFGSGCKGVRTPQNVPTATATYRDVTQYNFSTTGTELIAINLTRLKAPPGIKFSGTNLPDLLDNTVSTITWSDIVSDTTEQISSCDVISTGALTRETIGIAAPIASDRIRLVSGGIKMSKTSKSDSESGTVKTFYSKRGFDISTNLRAVFDDMIGSDEYTKEYLADRNGADSLIFQSNYKPTKTTEVEEFSKRIYWTSNRESAEYIVEEATAATYIPYYGPLVNVGTSAILVGSANTTSRWPVSHLTSDHICWILIEDATPGMSFDIDIVRHYEFRPDSSDLGRETTKVVLQNYDSVFSLIKNSPLNVIEPELNFPKQTVWDIPDVLSPTNFPYQWEQAAMGFSLSSVLKKHLPKLFKTIVKGLPGGYTGVAENLLKEYLANGKGKIMPSIEADPEYYNHDTSDDDDDLEELISNNDYAINQSTYSRHSSLKF